MSARSIEIQALARHVGVDPKTVQRWLAGRVPHPGTGGNCDLVEQIRTAPLARRGLGRLGRSGYIRDRGGLRSPGRCAELTVGRDARACTHESGSLGVRHAVLSGAHPQLAQLVAAKCAQGLRLRIALADPDAEELRPGTGWKFWAGHGQRASVDGGAPCPDLSCPGVQARFHRVPLYTPRPIR